jgi:glutamate-5-semialdehyde dehydrogenase
MKTIDLAKKIKLATNKLLNISEADRKKAIKALALALIENKSAILVTNQIDLANAKNQNFDAAFIDRLTVTDKTLLNLTQAASEIHDFEQVVGTIIQDNKRADGLQIQKQRIPIGLIAMVYESRPNVTVEAALLAIKSGNGLILKGGSEATATNLAFIKVITDATKNILPDDWIGYIDTRESFNEILKLNSLIDLIIPRGGEKLVQFVRENSTIPVIAHNKGLCHLYIHSDAFVDEAIKIVLNAKTQRPGVCNALESLLIHKDLGDSNISIILDALNEKGVELFGNEPVQKLKAFVLPAKEDNYNTEYLALKLSIKIVQDEDEAISHIQKYGSHHTEGILSLNTQVIEKFMNQIDASCITINASTRFNDGGELGLGAELGISTSKLHAYGPMGIKEMTTTRYIVRGNGHVRS